MIIISSKLLKIYILLKLLKKKRILKIFINKIKI